MRRLMIVTREERDRINQVRHPPKRTLPLVEVPGTGVTDLAKLLLALYAAVHPALRSRACWVMDRHWLAYVEQIGEAPYAPDSLTVLGLPVWATDDGGWPHLEPSSRLTGGGIRFTGVGVDGGGLTRHRRLHGPDLPRS